MRVSMRVLADIVRVGMVVVVRMVLGVHVHP